MFSATKGEVGLWETIACSKKYLFYIPATCQINLYMGAQEQGKIWARGIRDHSCKKTCQPTNSFYLFYEMEIH